MMMLHNNDAEQQCTKRWQGPPSKSISCPFSIPISCLNDDDSLSLSPPSLSPSMTTTYSSLSLSKPILFLPLPLLIPPPSLSNSPYFRMSRDGMIWIYTMPNRSLASMPFSTSSANLTEKAPLRRGTLVHFQDCKKRERTEVTWIENVRKDIEKLEITSKVTLNRHT